MGLDLDRIVFAYPARLPRHCTPARAIPSSHRRNTPPRHFSPRTTHSPPRPRLISQYTHDRSSTSGSSETLNRLEDLLRPLSGATPALSANPDKAWRAFLAVAEIEGGVIPMRLRRLLLIFATRLADSVFTMAYDSSSPPAEEMSTRAAMIRTIIQAIKDPSFPSRTELRVLDTCCKALEGRFEEVAAVLSKYCEKDLAFENPLDATPMVRTSRAVVRAIETRNGPEAAYDWLVLRWETLEQYLWSRIFPIHSRASRVTVADLRGTLAGVVERIDDLGDFLAKRVRAQPDGPWKEVGEHFIDALCYLQLPGDALGVMRQMTRLAIPPSIKIKLLLVKELAKGKRFESAHELYAQVCKEMDDAHGAELRDLWSVGLYLYAREGNVEKATEIFARLERRGWVYFESIVMMLHTTAIKGLAKATMENFERFFPQQATPSELKYGKPTESHYTTVLFALARAGLMKRVPEWLKRMTEDGIAPDNYTYNVLIEGYISSCDSTSLTTLLGRMRVIGVTLDLRGYTSIISFLARTGDSVEAERTYQRAIENGIKPDIKLLNALMYAHVQSGHWRGVVDVFGYIKALPGRQYRPTTPTCNILLKAFVLIGAPFSTIRALMVELEAMGARPDVHTFALLIQSACDHKEFDAALGLLKHMDKVISGTRLDVEITVYALTILMGSFLRYGDQVRAREMFEEMKSRRIVPTAITYSTISYAYARKNTSESLKLAEEFLKQLVLESEDDELKAGWVSASGDRSLALDTLYQPLMHIYAKLRRVGDVERLQRELLDHGGKTSLGDLTALLAVYRNCGDVAAGKETWSLIYDMASQRSKLGDTLSGTEPDPETTLNGRQEVVSQSNILCVPLSIYIDLLSSTGGHAETAKVWDQLQTNGFTFDSHNWNHLIIALIRAGEPERAFAILERVILPNVSHASSPGEAKSGRGSGQPDSPLSIVGDNEVSLPVQDGSPVEAWAWSEANFHRYNRRMEGIGRISKHLESHPMIDINPHGDLAHRLETLQLIPFTWNTWRPHPVTLSILSHALTRLASGMLVRPIQGDSGTPGASPDEAAPNRESARAILKRIYTNYHSAVRVVREFEGQKHERATGSPKDEQSIRWT